METQALQTTAAADTQQPAQPTTSAGLAIPELGAYWEGQGGIYIGQLPAAGDRPGAHIVVSTAEAESLEWGAYGTSVPGATSRHDGRANTRALLATGNNHPAAWCAQHTADGHQDFHLPSLLELQIASALAPHLFDQDRWYWSSTQYSPSTAFVQDFEHGLSFWVTKDYEYRVRAVRWIQL